MSVRKLLCLVAAAALLAAGVWWIRQRSSASLEAPFARARRERLVSTLVTNGKAEPSRWVAVRAQRQGAVEKVAIEKGAWVNEGAPLAEVDAREARAELEAASARVALAQAELDALKQGGRSVDLAEIDSGLKRARMDLEAAQRDLAVSRRLADKQAATRQEVTDAARKVEQVQALIQSLERRRAALVSRADTAAAEARLREVLASRQAAERRLELAVIRAPMAGVVYQLDARVGSYVNPGDLVAGVGLVDRLRVRVYVDEPELGRVAQGMPVTITWDALPGRQWKGTVDKVPTEVTALGTRQVGEVLCTIDNPGRGLLPGTNVNAEIISQVVDAGLTIPKEALRKQGNQPGVFLLEGERVVWRAIQLGASSVTRVVVLAGLAEGDAVALTSEEPLRDGVRVKPVFP